MIESHTGALRASLQITLSIALLAACTSLPDAGGGDRTSGRVSILAFGDSGYHYDYLDPKDYAVRKTARDVAFEELEDWFEDKRPPAEFRLPPLHVLERTGGVVLASGRDTVAQAMRSWCAGADCQFAFMLGDNIYPRGAALGADGHDDADRFRDLLELPFEPLAHGKPDFRIYAVLGNHDWYTSRAGALAQVAYMEQSPLYHMDGIRYSALPPDAHGEVEIFALDTHVLLASQTVYEPMLRDDGSEFPSTQREDYDPWVAPQTPDERDMVQWLEDSLQRSQARWKIVIGHHPLWASSGGKFEQARVLRGLILPALCRYADLYVAGHEHTVELHTDSCRTAVDDPDVPPLVNLVSGAASKQRPVNSAFMAQQDRAYPQKTTIWARGLIWGFAHIALEGGAGSITLLTTPDAGTGEPVVELEYAFTRRSGWMRGAAR
jgi:tartrate-resistant acid phosphatase type 5